MQIRSASTGHLYLELASTIRNQILNGTYSQGTKLPSESELMADTGCSRSTVRHALNVLVDEGLVAKERGRGAFVAGIANGVSDDLSFMSFTQMMGQRGTRAKTRTADAHMARAAGSIATFFDVPAGSPVAKLIRVRYLDDKPLCLETTYLPEEFSALVDEDLDGSLYELLKTRYHRRAGHGHKEFEVCLATQNEAFLLDVARNTPLMLITDYVYDTEGVPLHVSKRVQRTDRAKYIEPIGR